MLTQCTFRLIGNQFFTSILQHNTCRAFSNNLLPAPGNSGGSSTDKGHLALQPINVVVAADTCCYSPVEAKKKTLPRQLPRLPGVRHKRRCSYQLLLLLVLELLFFTVSRVEKDEKSL